MNKTWLIVLLIVLNVFAHDEGHGPKLKDTPKQGGIITSVVLAKEASLGTKAALVYKAELVRLSNNSVRLYYYDQAMNLLRPGLLSSNAKAVLITSKKGKIKTQSFELKFIEDHYEGISPKPEKKPYNIDVKVTEGNRELLAAFDNLD